MIAADILLDGFFAAVAAVGFGAVSDPPMRAFPRIALLAAVGHALRFCLMNCAGMDIATASLCAATAIGFGSLWLGKAIRCPMTALYIPALLPMVPGIYAYKTVFSLIMFLQSLNDPGQGMQYMQRSRSRGAEKTRNKPSAWRLSGIPSLPTTPRHGPHSSR